MKSDVWLISSHHESRGGNCAIDSSVVSTALRFPTGNGLRYREEIVLKKCLLWETFCLKRCDVRLINVSNGLNYGPPVEETVLWWKEESFAVRLVAIGKSTDSARQWGIAIAPAVVLKRFSFCFGDCLWDCMDGVESKSVFVWKALVESGRLHGGPNRNFCATNCIVVKWQKRRLRSIGWMSSTGQHGDSEWSWC